MLREGHLRTGPVGAGSPAAARPPLWCGGVEGTLTMPDPNCCSRPLLPPCEPPKAADGRLDLIDCMLLLSRKGTLLLVFGIDPPYVAKFHFKHSFSGQVKKLTIMFLASCIENFG